MPMLKTAESGKTSITNVKKYLEKAQRQEHASHAEELNLYEDGNIQLSDVQVGRLKDYLGETSRALSTDVSDDLTKAGWAKEMDLTRIRYGHERQTRAGSPRTYHHFILSPGIDDNCDLETMRAYAIAWAEESFRSGDRLYEYAIVYHDDNAKGVLHAHIIVNVTNKATGKKLHLANKDVVALGNAAQDIGERFGLSPIRPDKEYKHIGVRTSQPIYMTRGERELLNKGQYSWKWELRKIISDIAPLSSNFDDFKLRMNQAGYDVTQAEKRVVDEEAGRDESNRPIYKLEYKYLVYTHRNGKKIRDSKLGARFYPESIERDFSHEQVIGDRSYDSWELIKISKGQIPWKEDIRRAIDAVAPTVMSVPELEEELKRRYGIQMSFNRRGITYRHSSGYRARDISIGLRYTFEGLQQNAVVANMTPPYPDRDAILERSAKVTRHYLPRSAQGVESDAHEKAASHLVYRDLTDLMLRNELTRIDDISPNLENRYKALRKEKAELAEMRNEVMRWNHLAVLQSRYERDRDFLQGEGKGAEPSLYNETLIRSERLGLYLREQADSENVKEHQKALNKIYEDRLDQYQKDLDELNGDRAVYQNYLLMGGPQPIAEGVSHESSVNVRALFAAGRTLSDRHIKNFFHLSQSISQGETSLDLAEYRLRKAQECRDKLELVQSDIRSYREAKAYLPVSGVLADRPAALDVESYRLRFKETSERLASAGIGETDFATQQDLYRQSVQECQELEEERDRILAYVSELKEAQNVCQSIADSLKSPIERDFGEGKKDASSEATSRTKARSNQLGTSHDETLDSSQAITEEIPIREAGRRWRERLRQSPERSRRHRDELDR